MKKRFTFFLLAVLILSMPLQTLANEGAIPSFPALSYGDVTINNQPAEIGIEVIAKVDGKVVGTILIDESGKFGGPGTDSKLLIDGDGLTEKNVEFFLNGKQGNIKLDVVKVKEEPYWGSGEVKKIDLDLKIEKPAESTPSGGGGGGAVVPLPPTDHDIIVEGVKEDQVNLEIQDKKAIVTLNEEGNLGLEKDQILTLKVTEDVEEFATQLNIEALKNMKTNKNTLQLETNRAAYSLPVNKIDIEGIVEQFGKDVDLKNIDVNIKIVEPSKDEVQALERVASNKKVTMLVKPLDFTIEANYNNQTIEVKNFNGYVERMLAIPNEVNAEMISTAVVISPDGTMAHVPTKIVQKDGQWYAVIKSRTNSFYTVINNPIEFKDVEDHWSKEYVNSMASKMIIFGFDQYRFEPTKSITRAEFTAIMYRALGLSSKQMDNPFLDIAETAWYYDPIITSYNYGLIDGYKDGNFHPSDKITREQAMKIISSAMKLAEVDISMDEKTAIKEVSQFKDNKDIGDWALKSVAVNVKYGNVNGFKDHSLKPKNNMTRSEAAKMIHNMLVNAELIRK